MRTFIAAVLSAVVFAACSSGGSVTPTSPVVRSDVGRPADLTVTPLNAPASVFPSVTATAPTGIRGDLVSATVTLTGGATVGGLLFRGTNTWISLQVPGASSTAMYGPAVTVGGYRIAGSYKVSGATGDQGVIYNSVTKKYLTIDAPASLCAPKTCNYTIAHSSYGGSAYKVVGNYDAVSSSTSADASTYPVSGHAFLYDSTTKKFSTIDFPSATSTTAYGIWINGSTVAVAGGFTAKKSVHAYVRSLSGSGMLVYDYPKAAVTHFEGITGAGGPGNYNVIGDFSNVKSGTGLVYGFFLQIRKWKAGTPVVIGALSANSVFQRTVIGVYKNAGKESGYSVGIPIIDPPL
jgi:subtilase-type serine protease